MIETEHTPKPDTLKFLPGKKVSEVGPVQILKDDKSIKNESRQHLSNFLSEVAEDSHKEKDFIENIHRYRTISEIKNITDIYNYPNNEVKNIINKYKNDMFNKYDKYVLDIKFFDVFDIILSKLHNLLLETINNYLFKKNYIEVEKNNTESSEEKYLFK